MGSFTRITMKRHLLLLEKEGDPVRRAVREFFAQGTGNHPQEELILPTALCEPIDIRRDQINRRW